MRERHTTKFPGIRYRESPKGRRYIVGYSDANGVYHTKTMPAGATLEDARLEQGKLQARRAQGETLIRTKATVEDLLRANLEASKDRLGAKALEDYTMWVDRVLVPEFGRRRATELSPTDVARLIARLKREGKKTWTVKKILTPLSSAYRVAVRDGVVLRNPVEQLLPTERPKGDAREMRCLSTEELTSLLSSTSSPRWKTLFSLLAFSGLRISEALGLTWGDVTEDRLIIRSGKTRAAQREVILIPAVRSLLAAEKLKQAPGVECVFATQAGAPVGRREALRALRSAEVKAGLTNYTLHELRHTFASILISQGRSLPFIAQQMGHADPSITLKTYSHLFNPKEEVEAAITELQAAMGGMT